MKCPVCPAADVPADAKECPSCGTDLSPLVRLHQLAASQFNEALRLAQLGAVDAAITRTSAALSLDGQLAPARALLGKLLWRKGHNQEALGQWHEAAVLAPQDKEIQALIASADLKVRLMARHRRISRIVFVATILLGIVLIGVLPMWLTNSQTGRMVVKVEELEKYRFTHSRSNEDLAAIESELVRTRQAQQQVSESLTIYQQTHRATDVDHGELAQQIAGNEKELQAANSSLTAESDRRKEAEKLTGQLSMRLDQLAAQLGQVRQQQEQSAAQASAAIDQLHCDLRRERMESAARLEWLRNSMIPLFQSLRLANADELAARVRDLSARKEELQRRREEYEKWNLVPFRLMFARQDLTECEWELRACQAEYEAHVVPWERGMQSLARAIVVQTQPATRSPQGP